MGTEVRQFELVVGTAQAQSQRSSVPQSSPEGPRPTQCRALGEKVAGAATGRNPLVKASASP
eukprot:15056255-Alexandrium_andersonii.AAC.1